MTARTLPQRVSDIHAGAQGANMNGLRSINGRLYLNAESGEGYGQELYRLVPAPAVDADEDGMPDEWELEHGLNIAVNDAALDADFDGVPNGAEFTAGTNPADPISTFSAGLDGALRLSWPSIPGKTYLIESGDGTGWTPFQTVSAAPAPAIRTLLTVAPGASGVVRMFRVSVDRDRLSDSLPYAFRRR